jgi:hypothetical protein
MTRSAGGLQKWQGVEVDFVMARHSGAGFSIVAVPVVGAASDRIAAQSNVPGM